MVKEEYKDDIRQIIRCAFDVYNELHGGLMESIYESAMIFELLQKKFIVERQKEIAIHYKGVLLSNMLRMDMVVNNNIVLELKATDSIEASHRKQLFTYLSLTHMPIGLLINFNNNGNVVFEKYWYDADTNRCHAF